MFTARVSRLRACGAQETGNVGSHFVHIAVFAVYRYIYLENYKTKQKSCCCEIEDSVETHLCRLRAMLRSPALRVLHGLVQDIRPVCEEDKKN